MHRVTKTLQGLQALGELFAPAPAKPGVEHVMTEIAPGVFRSVHRVKAPPASRLLLELERARAVHDKLRGDFAHLQQRANGRRRSQR